MLPFVMTPAAASNYMTAMLPFLSAFKASIILQHRCCLWKDCLACASSAPEVDIIAGAIRQRNVQVTALLAHGEVAFAMYAEGEHSRIILEYEGVPVTLHRNSIAFYQHDSVKECAHKYMLTPFRVTTLVFLG